MGTKQFSNPQALSSALTALGMLQLQAIGLLNCLVPIVLASNYYLASYKITLYCDPHERTNNYNNLQHIIHAVSEYLHLIC